MSFGGTLSTTISPAARDVALAPRKSRRRTQSLVVAEGLMIEPTLLEIAGGTAAVFTTRSPLKSTANEDVAAIFPIAADHGILAVADGLGGHAGGERASRMAIEAIQQTVYEAAAVGGYSEGESLRPAILDGIEAANTQVRSIGSGSATTLVLVEIQDGVIRPYHVGDSALLLTGQRGKLKFQTIAHSPIGYAVESGMIKEEDAIHHEERHVISNVIGSEQMRVEMGPAIPMAARDTLVLASDGLLDNLLPAEIVELVRVGPLDVALAQLVKVALERMNGAADAHPLTPSKPDDLTVIAFRPQS